MINTIDIKEFKEWVKAGEQEKLRTYFKDEAQMLMTMLSGMNKDNLTKQDDLKIGRIYRDLLAIKNQQTEKRILSRNVDSFVKTLNKAYDWVIEE